MHNHVADAVLQQYAFDPGGLNEVDSSHIRECSLCLNRAETYRSIFHGIRTQPAASFDFDLSKAVMSKLSGESEKSGWSPWATFLAFVAGILVLATPSYIYRKSLYLFIKVHATDMAGAISTTVIYLVLTGVLAISLFQGYDLLRKYQRKIKRLNYY